MIEARTAWRCLKQNLVDRTTPSQRGHLSTQGKISRVTYLKHGSVTVGRGHRVVGGSTIDGGGDLRLNGRLKAIAVR